MIELGQKVVDTVSGLQGIAVARHEYLNGCIRITVQPKIDKDGKTVEDSWFDEEQLSVIDFEPDECRPKSYRTQTGGPSDYRPGVPSKPIR